MSAEISEFNQSSAPRPDTAIFRHDERSVKASPEASPFESFPLIPPTG